MCSLKEVRKIKKFVRVNEQIRATNMRLIGPEGEQLGIVTIQKAKEIADTINQSLGEIATTQKDDSVSREQHIGIYRQNLLILKQIKEDIGRMEKILVTAGGPASPEMLSKTRIKADEPTKTMTWILVFVIIIFIGLLTGVLFFTWHRQARLTREELLSAKESAFPETDLKEDQPNQDEPPPTKE